MCSLNVIQYTIKKEKLITVQNKTKHLNQSFKMCTWNVVEHTIKKEKLITVQNKTAFEPKCTEFMLKMTKKYHGRLESNNIC